MIEDLNLCNQMLKKRDAIIAELNAEKQARIEAPQIEGIILRPIDKTSQDYEDEITRLEELLTTASKKVGRFESENTDLEDTIKQLQSQLDQECDSNAKLEDNLVLKIVKDANKGLDNKIKLLEEKLAMCDKEYKKQLEDLQRINLVSLKYCPPK